MKKRVIIAGALSLKPKLILLDEPSSGLDKEGREELRKIYEHIKTNYPQVIILYSTHLEEDIFQCVDKIVEVKEGKIIFNGDLESYRGR